MRSETGNSELRRFAKNAMSITFFLDKYFCDPVVALLEGECFSVVDRGGLRRLFCCTHAVIVTENDDVVVACHLFFFVCLLERIKNKNTFHERREEEELII